NIDWNHLLLQLNVGVDTLLVGQPEFYKGVSQVLNSIPLSTWKDYLHFHLINGYASWLSPAFAEAHFNFYNRLLSGQKQPEPRWKRVSGLVNQSLRDPLGQLYVERYFPPEAKEYMVG